MQQVFCISDGEIQSLLPCEVPSNVDGREGSVEGERQCLLVPRLTVSEAGELLSIAEDELLLKPCPVNVENIQCGHIDVCGEEGLLEVLAEPAFGRTPAPRHLGEVEPSCIGEDKFHGLDEEGLKRFA